jgi:hypothetical protein
MPVSKCSPSLHPRTSLVAPPWLGHGHEESSPISCHQSVPPDVPELQANLCNLEDIQEHLPRQTWEQHCQGYSCSKALQACVQQCLGCLQDQALSSLRGDYLGWACCHHFGSCCWCCSLLILQRALGKLSGTVLVHFESSFRACVCFLGRQIHMQYHWAQICLRPNHQVRLHFQGYSFQPLSPPPPSPDYTGLLAWIKWQLWQQQPRLKVWPAAVPSLQPA